MSVKADIDFQKDLFEAANKMRGSVAPADYKHYVLPLIFLRYLVNQHIIPAPVYQNKPV